jgi:hypothetical protein
MNCICGHRDQAHVAGGRCRVPDCPCERFQPGDTVPEPALATHDFLDLYGSTMANGKSDELDGRVKNAIDTVKGALSQ